MAAEVAEITVWRGSDAHAFVVRNGISTRELANEIDLSPRRVRELFRMQRLSERDRQRIVAGVERLTRPARRSIAPSAKTERVHRHVAGGPAEEWSPPAGASFPGTSLMEVEP